MSAGLAKVEADWKVAEFEVEEGDVNDLCLSGSHLGQSGGSLAFHSHAVGANSTGCSH